MLLIFLILLFHTFSALILLIWGFFLLILLYCKYMVSGPPPVHPNTHFHQLFAVISVYFEAYSQESLDPVHYSSVLNTEYDQTCAICLDTIDLNIPISDLPCKHIFHSSCFDAWFAIRPLCPICKRNCN